MKVIETNLMDVYILEPVVHGDHRGWFEETWSKKAMEAAGFHYDFVQDNQSYSSRKGTIRGLHFQSGAAAQAKLVRCTRGAVLDVVVDLRRSSPTFGKWTSVELSGENHKQILIPRGFAHGYATLTNEAEFLYKVDNDYCPAAERGIRWNDPGIGVDWGITDPVIAQRDANFPLLSEIEEEWFK